MWTVWGICKEAMVANMFCWKVMGITINKDL